ncbi:MAG: gliding motility-associated C-terminal domain-containing protein [Bacteroidales bacterium]|jgi:gliding motility-associated-like protein|nr:gliding motility-associated C-terminal domain-containing protein [Bacteroidales bacterium]
MSSQDITLTVENIGNGHARLTFNKPSCASSVIPVDYTISRNFPDGVWQPIITIPNTGAQIVYVDSLWHCDPFCAEKISYRINISSGICVGAISNIIEACINDNEEPSSTQINAISVNPDTDSIELYWPRGSSQDTYGYLIFEGPNASLYDTVLGANTTVYTAKDLANQDLMFNIRAIDSCLQRSLYGGGWRQIFTCQLEQLSCAKNIRVSWTDPSNSITDVDHIDIMLSKNNGAYTIAKTVEPTEISTTIDSVEHLAEYKIYVRAVSANPDIASNSMSASIIALTAPSVSFAYLKTLTVLDEQTLEMHCHIDASNVWQNLFVYADSQLIKTVSYSEFHSQPSLLLPYQNADYYFEISDTCGDISAVSNTSRPIRLSAERTEQIVDLEFSAYKSWLGQITHYTLFEITNGDTVAKATIWPTFDPVYRYTATLTNVEQILYLDYFVRAYEDVSNPYGIRDSTQSNVVSVIVQNEVPVSFPTGFMPDGISKIYRPIYKPRMNDNMQFRIFNRFGQMIFSTNQPQEGWDGTFKGKPQPMGAYVYLFTITRNGITTTKRGAFTLIR